MFVNENISVAAEKMLAYYMIILNMFAEHVHHVWLTFTFTVK